MPVQYHTKAHPMIEEVCYPGHNSRVTCTAQGDAILSIGYVQYVCMYIFTNI